MAKGKASRRATAGKTARKAQVRGRSGKRQSTKSAQSATATKRARPKARAAAKGSNARATAGRRGRVRERTVTSRLERSRRTLEETVPTPPSSLNMDRHGSAARTGRAELNETLEEHGEMTGVSGGDLDVNIEQAYFSGDEAPGGDNPTPDQDIVDDIGKALGVEYQDNEELKSTDKVARRDKHRWELDPASAEDYKERK
jgi:Family of unknown function (DUF6335)